MKQRGATPGDARGLRFAIVASQFNPAICDGLLDGAYGALTRAGALPADIRVIRVPGAFEIPLAAQRLAETGDFDAVICVGAIIRGETPHFDVLAAAVANGVMHAGLKTATPTTFGVLTTNTTEEAVARSEPGDRNKGVEAAEAAIAMARLIDAIERSSHGRSTEGA